jgi:hypothetical protein
MVANIRSDHNLKVQDKNTQYNFCPSICSYQHSRSRRKGCVLPATYNYRDNTGWERVMEINGVGTMNENGELFADLCVNYDLVIGLNIPSQKYTQSNIDVH